MAVLHSLGPYPKLARPYFLTVDVILIVSETGVVAMFRSYSILHSRKSPTDHGIKPSHKCVSRPPLNEMLHFA